MNDIILYGDFTRLLFCSVILFIILFSGGDFFGNFSGDNTIM